MSSRSNATTSYELQLPNSHPFDLATSQVTIKQILQGLDPFLYGDAVLLSYSLAIVKSSFQLTASMPLVCTSHLLRNL